MDSKKDSQRVQRHVYEVNKCNQRGGRMLSIIDLLNSRTLDKKMAAYLLVAINKGSSFLVGSKPGGSGKTTIMGALLNFIPDIDIMPTESEKIIKKGFSERNKKCYLAHEIGHGSYYSYISGKNTENFLELSENHIIASNLHADNIDDVLAHEGINENNLTKIDLLIFVKLVINGNFKRRIGSVYENQGGNEAKIAFRKLFEWDKEKDLFRMVNKSMYVNQTEIEKAERIIDDMLKNGLKTIEDVRNFVLNKANFL